MSPIQTHNEKQEVSLTRYAWLSIAAAITTIILKTIAYLLTRSVGLLSDAAESIVNLLGATMALGMLTIAAWPPDKSHTYGHSKAEYFASTVEGLLILMAAGGIIWTAIGRFFHPRPLEELELGLAISTSASLINLVVARILMSVGKRQNSITLEADGQHLMTDVWTSAGVIGGIAVVALTNWLPLDPLVAIGVALNIIWTSIQLLRRSISGLMDASLPSHEQQIIEGVMAQYRLRGVDFHALQTRQAAARSFVSVHMLVPGAWTVHDAHHMAEEFEGDIRKALGKATVITHLEPSEDEISLNDLHLDR